MIDYYRVKWKDGESGGNGIMLQCQEIEDIRSAITSDYYLELLNRVGYVMFTPDVVIYKLNSLPVEGHHSKVLNRVRKQINDFSVKSKLVEFLKE